MIHKLWEKYGVILGVSALLISAGIACAPVLAYGSRITANEIDIANIKESMAAIRQEVHDLWHDAGHKE